MKTRNFFRRRWCVATGVRCVVAAILLTAPGLGLGEASAQEPSTEAESAEAESAEAESTAANSSDSESTEANSTAAETAEEDAGVPATPSAAAPGWIPSSDEGPVPTVRFAFQNAPWPDVLRQFAAWAGLTLDMTDVPEGEFSYFDNSQHTPAEAIDVLNGYLLPRGYALIRRDNFLVSLKTDNPALSNLIPTIPLSDLAERGENELVRVLVPVEEVSATQASEEIKGVLGPLGSATPLDSNEAVVLQGFGSNLRQAVSLLGSVVPQKTDDKLDFRSYPLEHVLATEAEKQIRNLFGLGSGTMNVSGARSEIERNMIMRARALRGGDERGRGRGENDNNNAPPVPLLEKVAMNMKVSALQRTNSLLVTATPEGLALVEDVLKSIDVPQDAQARAALDGATPVLRVYEITQASENEVAKTLDVVMPGVVVNEDSRHDSIHVLATPAEHREVDELIRILDGRGSGTQAMVEVIPIRRFDVYAMSDLLMRMFENDDDDLRPVIQPEPQTSTLVVRGTENQVQQIRAALEAYGEGTSDGGGVRSTIRTIRAPRVDADRVVRMARDILERDSGQDAQSREGGIRIVVPGESNAAPPRRAARELNRLEADSRDDIHSDDLSTIRSRNVGDAEVPPSPFKYTRLVNSSVDKVDAADRDGRTEITKVPASPEEQELAPQRSRREQADASPSDRIPQVHVEKQGDRLLLYSDNVEALDEVESTIRQLLPQMPPHEQWTVFYLRAAAAEETATRLAELMPGPIAPLTTYSSGYNSGRRGSSIASLARTAPTAAEGPKIVAEPRTNALFVSGTPTQVAQVEDLLEILDTIDTPESFRDRIPRAIKVQYADVNQMADVVRELYKDYLTDPAAAQRENDQRNRRDNNRNQRQQGGAAGQQSPGIRMTLAVDEQTNELLVACSEELFREVSALVRERDLAAQATEPTVSIRHVGSNLPVELDSILESYSPKITAEVTEATSPGIQNSNRGNNWNNRRNWNTNRRRGR